MRLQAFLLLISFQLANSLHVAVSDAVESSDVSACPNMTTLTGTSGIIKSPSYPGKYGNYHRCSWKIMASTGYRVKLVIQDMDIEGGTNCPFDYIQIQNAVIYGSGVLPGRLCGSLTSNSTFSSYHETLIVRFVTDGSVTARGFKARYTVIPGCALNYKKVGCFKDDRKNPRPVPVLVFTDRDVSSNVWSGKTIDWSNWDTYIVDLVRRCANESRARNYFHFSIQYYGECWSGSEVAKTYDRAGPSESCLTKGVMQKCNVSDDVECVGEANTNFVYEIKVPLILIGGSWPGEGRVEIYYNDTWGTVCDDSWDINDARVVCRQLGYSSAVSAPQNARLGQGSGKIWLDDVQCQGDESSIVNCRRSPWGVHNCGHSEDASVICSRLRLIGGSWPGEGRVEIYYRGSWGTVCDDLWDINDARVVCRQLGYSSAVSAPQNARFGQGSGKIWLDNVQCQGNENSIVNCQHQPWGVHNCGHHEDASVICSRT